jgi:hypothetical protein
LPTSFVIRDHVFYIFQQLKYISEESFGHLNDVIIEADLQGIDVLLGQGGSLQANHTPLGTRHLIKPVEPHW